MKKIINIAKMSGKIQIVSLLIIGLLFLTTGFLIVPNLADAAALTSVKCTLDDSQPTTGSKQTINFTTTNAVAAGETIKISYSDDWTIPAGFAVTDMTFTGATLVAGCDGGADEVTMTKNDGAGDKHVTFTVCAGDSVGAGAKVITLGIGVTKITNPTPSASYTIGINATTDSGNAMVYIISGVSVSATVAETLTFVIANVASSETVNGATTNVATTVADAVTFGTVSTATNKIAAHDLQTTTNAGSGYTVTTEYTGTLQVSSGVDIDDHAGTNAVPSVFPQSATAEDFGYTTDDATLAGTADRFTSGAGNKWAKFTTAPLEVAYHDGPADGSTTGTGSIRVGYQVGIAGVTPPGEHTTTIIYICTPTF